MGTNPFESWSHFEALANEENGDFFSFPNQPTFLDSCSGYDALDNNQFEILPELPPFPALEIYPNDTYSLLDFGQRESCMLPDVPGELWNESGVGCGYGYGYEYGFSCNEVMNGQCVDEQNGQLVIYDGSNKKEEMVSAKEKKRITRDQRESCSKKLSRNCIAKCFYMPITQAAKELNIGLTLLKKRCRELGIRRWPHRKLNSLQTLINNVQEMENQGGQGDHNKLREAIEILEYEKKLMEEIPDMELEDKTKRLRQACFKANYKKRKLMTMVQSGGHANIRGDGGGGGGGGGDTFYDNIMGDEEEEEETMKFLLTDCSFSSSDKIFNS